MTSRSAPEPDAHLLVRRLRASAMVNAQLHAQLRTATAASNGNGTPSAPSTPVRRGGVADAWIEDLLDAGTAGAQPRLVATGDGTVWLLEGELRRQVRAGQLVATLAEELGPPEPLEEAAAQEVEARSEGPAVEVLEAPSGPPFIVVAGARRDLRGVLVTYPVSEQAASVLEAGTELSVRSGPSPRPAGAGDRPQGGTSLRRSLARQARRARRVLRRLAGGAARRPDGTGR